MPAFVSRPIKLPQKHQAAALGEEPNQKAAA